jgi:carbon monoxide dehydrogenase subunit G
MSSGQRACLSVLVAALLVCCSLCAAASDADLKKISVTVEVAGDLVTIDASLRIAASPKEVWEVLTDFDHMAEIVTNLQSSKVLSRSATTLVVAQQGRASAGPLTFAFETVREVELKPFYEIRARLLHGSMRKLEGTTRLIAESTGTRIVNHGEFITDVWVPPVIGPGFIEAETRKQYDEMRREILRRSKLRSQAESRGTATGAAFSEPGRAID